MIEQSAMNEAYDALANLLECDREDVEAAFRWEGRWHEDLAPKVLQSRLDALNAAEALMRAVGKVCRLYDELPDEVCEKLLASGGLTFAQLTAFEGLIYEVAMIIKERHLEFYERRGGKDWQAEQVALNVATLFINLRIDLTTGHNDGKPSTKFGKAVQLAFRKLGIDGDWRRPAERARKAKAIALPRVKRP